MSKEETKKGRAHCYLTWGVFLVFSVYMLTVCHMSAWKSWFHIYILAAAVLMTCITWYGKMTEKVQSYAFVLISMLNITIYSVIDRQFYASAVVLCTLVALVSIYMNFKLMILLTGLSIVLVGIHVFFMDTLQFGDGKHLLAALILIFAIFFTEIFLTFFVHRQCRVEESLKESVEEARKAERSKSDFLANMSHEIRTPMNAIVGMCELILREDISEEVRENCFNIQHSGRSLLSIINDILDFSKIESGKVELIEESFNIGSTINDVINMAVTRKDDKDIEIIARVDPDIPKGLVGDEGRIKQVMINLVTNAVKFTNKGCVVLKISQNRYEYGINLNVSVSDTGIGITEENMERLFTSFLQVDTKKNRAVEGTGLGLAISKRLVARMGGFVNVSSTYGEGSTFKFVIPLKVSDPEPFIQIREDAKRKVAIVLDFEKYKHARVAREYTKLIHELGEKFCTEFVIFQNAKELKTRMETEPFSHCFTAKEEYLEDTKTFMELAKKVQLLVIQDRMSAIDLPEKVKCIYKPFYAMSVAAVLNNEKYIYNVYERKAPSIRFVAPEARVLIVDDNIMNLKVAEGLMKPYNMKITTVVSGKDAIEALKMQDFDIVFMDHMMPEMDGVEATALIRGMEGEYYKKMPIVALTANAVNGAREMFLASGFHDFIAKPIELSSLDRVLRNWLPKERMKQVSGMELSRAEETKTVESKTFQEVICSEKGLMYAGENQEVYFANLLTYLKSGPGYRKSLQERFEKEDWTHYGIEIHALKSSSLSIGAESLSGLAKELEFAGKEGNFEIIRKKHAEVVSLYGKVLEEIEEYLEQNKKQTTDEKEDALPETAEEITEDEFVTLTERMRTACEQFDGDGIVAAVEELEQYTYHKKALKPCFARVKLLAEDFEYDKALEAMVQATQELREVR